MKIQKKNTNLKQAINSINESTKIQKEYLPIYKLLSNEPIHINDIAKKLETTIKEITPVITMMEIEGYTHQIQTNYFVRLVRASSPDTEIIDLLPH